MPFEELCKKAKSFGYDGLESAARADHFEVGKALTDSTYIPRKQVDVGQDAGLVCYAISNHLVGQAVCEQHRP
jgi:sugar phosphate isomerase/epimerase